MVVPLTPPHDIRGKVIGDYVAGEKVLMDLQKKSYEILSNHPINQEQEEKGTESGKQSLALGSRDKTTAYGFQREDFTKKEP